MSLVNAPCNECWINVEGFQLNGFTATVFISFRQSAESTPCSLYLYLGDTGSVLMPSTNAGIFTPQGSLTGIYSATFNFSTTFGNNVTGILSPDGTSKSAYFYYSK